MRFTQLVLFIIFLISYLTVGSSLSIAQTTIYFGTDQDILVLDSIWYLEDQSRQMTLEEVEKSQFQVSQKHNFGLTTSAYWIKLNINNQATIPLFLEVDYPVLDSVTFFYKKDGVWQTQVAGDGRSIKELTYKHYQPLLQLDTKPNENLEVFVRVVTEGKLTIPLQLKRLDQLNAVCYFGSMYLHMAKRY